MGLKRNHFNKKGLKVSHPMVQQDEPVAASEHTEEHHEEGHGGVEVPEGTQGTTWACSDGMSSWSNFCRWDVWNALAIPWFWHIVHTLTSGVIAQVASIFLQTLMSYVTGHSFADNVTFVGADLLQQMNFFPKYAEGGEFAH